jgi:hypothetical protein
MFLKRNYQQRNNYVKQTNAPQQENNHWKKVETEPLERNFTTVFDKGNNRHGKLGGHQKGSWNQIWGYKGKNKLPAALEIQRGGKEGSTIWRVDRKLAAWVATRVAHVLERTMAAKVEDAGSARR